MQRVMGSRGRVVEEEVRRALREEGAWWVMDEGEKEEELGGCW
jgi:hypothetical protein